MIDGNAAGASEENPESIERKNKIDPTEEGVEYRCPAHDFMTLLNTLKLFIMVGDETTLG